MKARGSSGSEGRADAPRWAAANGRPGRLPPPNPHRQPGNSIIQFREMTSDNATRAGPSRTPPTQCRRAQSDLAMQVSWSGTVRSYVGDVILGLVPENEGAVAADGDLVDALATACRPLTLARPADGRARVVRARMRFTNRPVPPGAPVDAPTTGPLGGTNRMLGPSITFNFMNIISKRRSGCWRSFLPKKQANTALLRRSPGTQAHLNGG